MTFQLPRSNAMTLRDPDRSHSLAAMRMACVSCAHRALGWRQWNGRCLSTGNTRLSRSKTMRRAVVNPHTFAGRLAWRSSPYCRLQRKYSFKNFGKAQGRHQYTSKAGCAQERMAKHAAIVAVRSTDTLLASRIAKITVSPELVPFSPLSLYTRYLVPVDIGH